jgi:hypothetical protein
MESLGVYHFAGAFRLLALASSVSLPVDPLRKRHMTKSEIDKFEAAQRQLDCAIRLWFVDEDSIAIHTLAYAACCLLRDLFGSQKREVLGKFEVSQKFGVVPNFLKHADRDPEYVLIAHSKGSVHLTLAFAIRLWEEHGREKTSYMLAFSELNDPFKPGHQASEALKLVRHGPITDQNAVRTEIQRIITLGSTGGASVLPKDESER